MVIAVALLGFGAAGTFLSLYKDRLAKKHDFYIPILMLISAFMQISAIFLSQLSFIQFDSYLIFSDYSQIVNLILTYLILFLPFFFGALAIGTIFFVYVENIGKLYFSNLTGSGFGGIIALVLFGILLTEKIASIIAMFSIFAAGILFHKSNSKLLISALILTIGMAIFFFTKSVHLNSSQFKNISKTLNLPKAEIVYEQNSPYGLIEVVSSPALRYSQGLSLVYTSDVPKTKAVFINGDWFGGILETINDSYNYLNYSTDALPYSMNKRNKVLILNAGSGHSIAQALSNNAEYITGVEQITPIISIMKNEFAEESDSLYHNKKIVIKNIDSRTFLKSDTCKYDLISLPYTNSFGGSSGLFALQEQYLLTVESFEEMFNKLDQNGVISVSCWIDYPYRNPLKILSTFIDMFNRNNIIDYENHIAAVKSWGTISFVIKKSPITSSEIADIKSFCDSLLFDPVILGAEIEPELEKYNKLQDRNFYDYAANIISNNRDYFYSEYDFNVKAATDDKPYFSQFLRLSGLSYLQELYGTQNTPFIEIGYLIVIITFIQVLFVALILILLPLRKTQWNVKSKIKTLLYFSAIGLAYMFIEIIFIQKFILYFGNFVYAAAAVICFMLVCSGAGSFFSKYLINKNIKLSLIVFLISLCLLLYYFFLTTILNETIGFELYLKIFVSFILIAIPSFLMGMPFPIGLTLISEKNKTAIPWAWGINGYFSVIASPLAIIIAVESGYSFVIFVSGLLYLTTIFSNRF
jgi:spermidine synthase